MVGTLKCLVLTSLLVVAGCSSKSSHSQSGGAGGQATGGASGMGGGQAGSAGMGGVGGCPSWCGGGDCVSGVCELDANETAADFLAQDDEYLYWTESTKVRRIPKDRHVGTQSIADLGSGSTLEGCAVDATHIYFAVKNDGVVYRAKKDGSELHTALFANGPAGPVDVAIDAQHVYWTNVNQGTVERVSKTSGPTETIASNLPGLWGLAVDDSEVYFATDQALFSCAKSADCVPKELTNGSASSGWRTDPKVRLGNSSVFFTATEQVFSVPIAGGKAIELEPTPEALDGLAFEAGAIYWATTSSGKLKRSDLKGQLATVASQQPYIEHIVVDEQFAYWFKRRQAASNEYQLRKTRLPTP